MTNFSDLNISTSKRFVGDKIKIAKIFNREIVLKDFKIEDSKFEGKGDRLKLHFELDGEEHITFTASKTLMEMVKRIPSESFPVKTTIVKEGEYFVFT
ncbi:hypothetical protein [Albibacterium profundi]|uniref:Uncharacterized protein n=1 Tax=Albibacterium profundi TaxID=3134906 RepID=A0ABV5CEZ8_9SPHI